MTAPANGVPENAPVFTPPAPAPHAVAAVAPMMTEEEERAHTLREAARLLREAPRAIPITDVAVIIGMKARSGKREEIIYDVGLDNRIIECTYSNKEKVRAVTQDGKFLGYEPTGENELTLKVKYFKET